MGAPSIDGYMFVRTTEGRVRLLSMMDFHDGYTSFGTVEVFDLVQQIIAG